MKKLFVLTLFVNLCLGSFGQNLSPSEQAFEDRMEKKKLEKEAKQNNPLYIKTGGQYLKEAGIFMYSGIGSALVGGAISYFGNNRIDNLIEDELINNDDLYSQETNIASYKDQRSTINTVSYVFYGAAITCNLIAIGKIIKAGSVLDAERKEAQVKMSFNFTNDGLTLAYRF